MFLAIVSCLAANNSVTMWNQVSSAAQSHKLALSYFSFIAALEDTRSVLAYAPELCVKLQGAYVDVGYAYREVSNVKYLLC